MPGIEQINKTILRAQNDAENALASLGNKSYILNNVTRQWPTS